MTENANLQVVYLPVEWLHVRHNARQKVDPDRDAELAESIRRDGVLQPLVVREVPKQAGLGVPGYWIVYGHRRLVAAREAGLATVPAIVRDLTDQEARELQLVENLQRQDLDPLDEARAYRELLDLGGEGYTQHQLAQRLGISQAQVANRLRLLRLPAEVQSNISREILSAGHGLALLKLEKAPEALTRAAHHLAETKAPVARAAEAVEEFVADKGKSLEPSGVGPGTAPRFDTAGCKDCDNRVQGRRSWPGAKPAWFCVDPACWDTKQAAAEKAIEAAQQAQVRELTVRGVEVLASEDVNKLNWNSYASLGPDNYELRGVDLSGCEGCERRKMVRRPWKDEPLPYCFNPSCLRRKKAAATRTATAAKQAAHDARVAAVRAWAEDAALAVFCEEPPPGGPADFDATLLLAALVLSNVQPDWRYGENQPKVQTHLRRTRGWDLGLTAGASPSTLVSSAWPVLKERLAELDGEKLLALALEWAAVNLGRTEMMRWAMGEAAEPEKAKDEALAAPYGGDDLGDEDGDEEPEDESEEGEPEEDEADEDGDSDDGGPDDEAA